MPPKSAGYDPSTHRTTACPLCESVRAVAVPVLAHRIMPGSIGREFGRRRKEALQDFIETEVVDRVPFTA